jgi:hypothetical protein
MEFINFIWPGIIWLIVLAFIVLLARFIIKKLYPMANASTGVNACNCTILSTIIVVAFLGWTLHIFGRDMYIIPLIGIACLAIPLILSVSSDYNLGSKLDSGEIRKSIVISLTIIYIIFLAISFEKSINEPDTNIQSYNADFNMSMVKLTPEEIGNDSNASPQKQNMRIKANYYSSRCPLH